MNKEETLEAQKRMATFMGYTYYPFEEGSKMEAGWKKHPDASAHTKLNKTIHGGKDAYLCRSHNCLPYRNNWNALIEVYNKARGTVMEIMDNNEQVRAKEFINARSSLFMALSVSVADQQLHIERAFNKINLYVTWYLNYENTKNTNLLP